MILGRRSVPILLLTAFAFWPGSTTVSSERRPRQVDGVEAPTEPGQRETAADRVAASVNDEVILLRDVERELGRIHSSGSDQQPRRFDLDRLMFRMVNDVLLGQEARALGMDGDPAIVSKVSRRRRSLALEKLVRLEIEERTRPTEDEVSKEFAEQYRRISFRIATDYERAGAEALLEELQNGADFETLARERSVDPYALRGGLMGDVPKIDLQLGIGEMVFSLEPGQLGGPVRTDLGWSVLQVESKHEADPDRFSGVERSLHRLVRHRKSRALRASLAGRARERHPVKTDDSVIERIHPKRLDDARLIPEYDDPDAVAVRIGETEVITAGAYARALLDRWSGVRNIEAARAAAPIVLKTLIDERLLLAEALGRGYARDPAIVRAVRSFETQLLIPRYLEEIVAAGVEVTREEMENYYDDHRDGFRKPPRLRLGQITVSTLDEAERIAGLLRAGTDLGWLAKRHSIDRFKEKRGDRGWFDPKPATDEFSRRLLDSEVGTVLDPTGEPGNFIVTRILAREEQEPFRFASVSGNVREAVFTRNFQAELDALMNRLRERSEISINDELLANLSITGAVERESTGGEQSHAHGH